VAEPTPGGNGLMIKLDESIAGPPAPVVSVRVALTDHTTPLSWFVMFRVQESDVAFKTKELIEKRMRFPVVFVAVTVSVLVTF
jgi:hypothetical protein